MTLFLVALLASLPGVHFELEPCIGDTASLERQMQLELGALPAGPLLAVNAWCVDDTVVMEVHEGKTRRSHREIELPPAARPAAGRLLALALAEMVSAARKETLIPGHSKGPLFTSLSDEERDEPLRKPWAAWLQVEGLMTHAADTHLGFGARVGLERTLRWFSLRGEIGLEHLSEKEPLGQLDGLIISGSAGPQFRPWARLPISLGVSGKFGLVRLAGISADPIRAEGLIHVGPFVAGVAHVKARLASLERAGLVVGTEVGFVVLPFQSKRSDALLWGYDGAWLAVTLGWEMPW